MLQEQITPTSRWLVTKIHLLNTTMRSLQINCGSALPCFPWTQADGTYFGIWLVCGTEERDHSEAHTGSKCLLGSETHRFSHFIGQRKSRGHARVPQDKVPQDKHALSSWAGNIQKKKKAITGKDILTRSYTIYCSPDYLALFVGLHTKIVKNSSPDRVSRGGPRKYSLPFSGVLGDVLMGAVTSFRNFAVGVLCRLRMAMRSAAT